MGDAAKNVMALAAKNKPNLACGINIAFVHKLMLRPGIALFMYSADHRVFEGRHQAYNAETKEWMEMGPHRDEDVWVVEEQGEPGPEIWCLGVFLAVQAVDSVAVNGKKRVVTMQTPQLIGTIPAKDIKQLERTLLFGDGQSSILAS